MPLQDCLIVIQTKDLATATALSVATTAKQVNLLPLLWDCKCCIPPWTRQKAERTDARPLILTNVIDDEIGKLPELATLIIIIPTPIDQQESTVLHKARRMVSPGQWQHSTTNLDLLIKDLIDIVSCPNIKWVLFDRLTDLARSDPYQIVRTYQLAFIIEN